MPPKATSIAKTPTAPNRKPLRAITPDYVQALMSYADILYKGGLGPKEAARPERVAALIEIGRDVGLPATMAIQWIAIINGKPCIWGDAAMALIRASGFLDAAYPKEGYEGEPGTDEYAAVFAVKRVGQTPERVARFSVADAKRAHLWGKKGPWTEYPERQLMWRAKGFACRDEFQDVLCGLIFAEEALDYPQQDRVTVIESKPAAPAILPPGPQSEPAKPKDEEPDTITDDQIERLFELRESLCVAKNCRTDDEKAAAWKEAVASTGAESALHLTRTQAASFIAQLEKVHDPFPPAASTTPAT